MKKVNFVSKFMLTLTMFFTVILLGGCSPEYIQQQGIYGYDHKDYLYGAAAFKLVLEEQPDNPNAYYWLGKTYNAAGDYEAAISNIKKAIEINGRERDPGVSIENYNIDLGQAYFELANAYYENTDYQEAAKTLNKLNTIDATTCTKPKNIFKCTAIYDNAGQVKDAIDLQNRYEYPQDEISRKYRMLAYLYLRNHNYDTAMNLSAKAIEEMPDNELAYYIIGMAKGEIGQYDQAIAALRKAAQVDKNNTVSIKRNLPIYINLAYYLAQNGQYDAAMAAYNDAIQTAKLKDYYHKYTTMSYGGVPYEASSRISVSFDDYSSMINTASAEYNIGKYEEALQLLNDYINKSDTGTIGLIIRDSYYLSNMSSLTYIFSVKSGSTAEKAGIQFGDKILAIDGKSVKYKSAKDLENLISGPIGTEVTLKVERINNPLEKYGSKKKTENLKKDKKTEKVILEKTLIRERTTDKNKLGELARAYGLRSLIYRAMGNNPETYSDAQTAIDYNPESFDAKLAWGYANIDKGNYNDALKVLSNAKPSANERLYSFDLYYFLVSHVSDDELINLGKAIAYLKQGKVNEAINYIPVNEITNPAFPAYKEYQALTSELNNIAQEHNEKAVNLEKKGFLKEALNEYTLAFKYVSNEKTEEEIRNNILNLLQEYPVTSSIPEDARKYLVRGEVLFKQGDITGSLNECKKGMKLAPYEPKFYYNVAELNGGLKNYDKAIKYMNFYMKLSPNAPDIQTAKDDITKWEFLIEKN